MLNSKHVYHSTTKWAKVGILVSHSASLLSTHLASVSSPAVGNMFHVTILAAQSKTQIEGQEMGTVSVLK